MEAALLNLRRSLRLMCVDFARVRNYVMLELFSGARALSSRYLSPHPRVMAFVFEAEIKLSHR